MAIANLHVRRTVNLPDALADPLIERLKSAGAESAANQIVAAKSTPAGVELASEHFGQVQAALDAWAAEEQLHPRLQYLRQLLEPEPEL